MLHWRVVVIFRSDMAPFMGHFYVLMSLLIIVPLFLLFKNLVGSGLNISHGYAEAGTI